MKTIVFLSEIDIREGNSAGAVRMRNYIKALRQTGSADVRIIQFAGHPFSFFKGLSKEVSQLEDSSILFYPVPLPRFEIMFLLWAKLFYHGKIYCEVNEVRRFEQSWLKRNNFVMRFILKCIFRAGERLVSLYDGIVCISSNIRQYFSKYNVNSLVIPVLSDIPGKAPCTKPLSNPVNFCFVGSLAIEKENLIELVRGFSLLATRYGNWVFNCYGSPPENDYSEIESLVLSYGLDSKIRLNGPVGHNDVPEIISSADYLILPRNNNRQNYYGFATKLSEYAVSGTPIIMTDTGVVTDYFRDSESCLLVRGYSAEDFFVQLKRAMEMPEKERSAIAGGAYSLACRHFDYKLYSTVLSDFLQSRIKTD